MTPTKEEFVENILMLQKIRREKRYAAKRKHNYTDADIHAILNSVKIRSRRYDKPGPIYDERRD